MDIEDIKKINLNAGDILLVRLPPEEFGYQQEYADVFRKIFPGTKIIITRCDVKVDVFNKSHFDKELFEI